MTHPATLHNLYLLADTLAYFGGAIISGVLLVCFVTFRVSIHALLPSNTPAVEEALVDGVVLFIALLVGCFYMNPRRNPTGSLSSSTLPWNPSFVIVDNDGDEQAVGEKKAPGVCVECKKNGAEYCILPCRHFGMCRECTTTLSSTTYAKCQVCEEYITSCQLVLFS